MSRASRSRHRRHKVFEFLREPGESAALGPCVRVGRRRSRPARDTRGSRRCWLEVSADAETGTVDWRLAFPDGSVGIAQSRVTETTRGTCIYSFVLHAPPVALEQVEGALEAQSVTLQLRAGDVEIVDGSVMTEPMTLEDVARRAIDGDRDAARTASSEICRAISTALPSACCGIERTQRTRRRRSWFAPSHGCRNSTSAASSRRGSIGSPSTTSST